MPRLGAGNAGSQVKAQRVTIPSVGAAARAAVVVTWAVPFANTDYTVVATIEDTAALSASPLAAERIQEKTATSVTVVVENEGISAKAGTLHVLAIAD